MQIGLLLNGFAAAPALGALAAEAEALGFDSLWAGDHVAFPAPIIDPLQLLAIFASHTRRVRLGTCVYLLPLRHPTVVAKMIASLDVISGGRVVFGIGVGGEFPGEFQACGVPVNQRGARCDEAIGVLRKLWQDGEAEHAGKFFSFERVRLRPPPAQAGGPPIWVGGRTAAAVRRTARYGDGYVGYLLSPDGFRERMGSIRDAARAAGRGEQSITAALMTFAAVDANRDAAVDRAGAILGAMYGRDMHRAAARYCVAGTPDDCAAAVDQFAAAGVEHLILTPLAYGDGSADHVRALAAALRLPSEAGQRVSRIS